jgi:arylsulfatase A-like enzyme
MLWSGASPAPAAAAPLRNVLLVIADDVGADGLSFTATHPAASVPPTPNLAALAARGVNFRQAYANPTCSPTRAAILTGRYGFRTGVTEVLDTMAAQGIYTNEFTLPEALAATHRRASFGKWHLGSGNTGPAVVGGWPSFSGALGGALGSASSNYTYWSKVSNGVTRMGYTNYATTDNVNDALTWLGQQGTNRWFLWLAFNAGHAPFHKPPTNLAPAYAGLSGTGLDLQQNPRPYYEASLQALDRELGRLLAAIDTNQTAIIFLGDNGSPGRVIQPPYVSTRAKDTLYEGGVRVPLVIAGPDIVNPGRSSDAVVHAVDVHATVLDLAGVGTGGRPAPWIVDSRSLLPLLLDQPFTPAQAAVLMENSGSAQAGQSGRAARLGQHKLIRFSTGGEELYDLAADPLEQTNLLASPMAPAQQAALDHLRQQVDAWSNRPNIVTQSWSSGLAVETPWFAGGNLSLWRSPGLAPAAWVQVTNALRQDRGATLRLTDPAPPAGGAFYRLRME